MRRLTKSVGPAALYVTLFLVPLFAANGWLEMTENHYEMSFREIYEGSPEYDIIFLGPSHTMHGVHTQYIEEGTGLKAGLMGPTRLSFIRSTVSTPLKKRISWHWIRCIFNSRSASCGEPCTTMPSLLTVDS